MQRAMAMKDSCPRLGFVRVCIFWFTVALNISVTHCKQLDTEKMVSTTCGANVTLTCNASTSLLKDSKVIKFDWQFKNRTQCQYKQDISTSNIQCKTTNTTSELTLTLTILDIIPANEGVYHCKLHTTSESANGQSHVKVEECLGSSEYSMDKKSIKCSFDRVFPSGEIHWYQGDSNLTYAAKREEMWDKNGFYNVQSEIPTETGNKSQPYNCSLWIPSLNRYISSHLVVSSGTTGQLQSIYIMMGILMMTFIM